MQKKFITILQLTILLFLANTLNAQQVTINKNGEEITDYGNLISIYDPFTDYLEIKYKNNDVSFELEDSLWINLAPYFSGTQECFQNDCQNFNLYIFSRDTSIIDFFNLNQKGMYSPIKYPVLYDSERGTLPVTLITEDDNEYMISGNYNPSMMIVTLNHNQIDKIIRSETTKVRIEGYVIPFEKELKSNFVDILSILNDRRSKYMERRENKTPSPYELKWEGNIERDPIVQPLPKNTSNNEGVVSVRFQVKPDGSVGLIIPLKKNDPELEKEVLRTLRSWKFSKLSKDVPQQVQWGIITFKSVFY